jgi:hypothetical protein
MTSAKAKANRTNAQASTGPKNGVGQPLRTRGVMD